MFLDRVVITVTSGKGGDGFVSFRREKYVPKGGPDGGDGGKGGDVIIRGRHDMDTLYQYRFTHEFEAESGNPGFRKNMSGKGGDDLILDVPCGTVVKDAESGAVLADLLNEGDTFLVAKGGRGGKGNKRFVSSVNQVPREFTPGEPGITRSLLLELKLIADVGIIGLPNAGKSTLITRMTSARPKIADYPFTTLTPSLGVVSVGFDKTMVMADIPGLIEGAAQGLGLGHEFLRHIERTRVLLHLVECMPMDGSDPWDNYLTIRRELERYSSDLMGRPELVVLNKCDLHGWEDVHTMLQNKLGSRVLPVSAATGFGLQDLVTALLELLKVPPKW